jgi:hypothetical protein
MTKPELDPITQDVSAALTTVQNVRNRIPAWQRSLAAALTEAVSKTPDFEKLKLLLEYGTGASPGSSAAEIDPSGEAATSPQALLGTHAGLLATRLTAAGKWWDSALGGIEPHNGATVLAGVQGAQTELRAAMQHSLFLTFAGDVSRGHVGQSRGIDSYCSDWGLSTALVDRLWSWLQEDPLVFDGKPLPVALDTVNRCAYRKADPGWQLYLTAAAPILGVVAAFALVALLFLLLHAAGLTTWPAKWVWKMLVLVLFVSIGAVAHIGSRALDINFDNPMKVYDAGNLIVWLSLRWVSVLRMFIPVVFVVAALWGAGNIPTSFAKLGTALLAGYTADSAIRSALSGLQSRAAGKQPSTPPATGSGSTSAGTAAATATPASG